MPLLYDPPVKFLTQLSRQYAEGWRLVEFDYHKEKVVIEKDNVRMRAIPTPSGVEWQQVSSTPTLTNRVNFHLM